MPKGSIPDHLRCPINKSLFVDAVSTSDGQTYERAAITKWINQHGGTDVKSPMTNLRLAHVGLCVNLHIMKEVAAFKATLIKGEKLETALLQTDMKTLDSCLFIDDQITMEMIGKVVLHNSLNSCQWLLKQGILAVADTGFVFMAVAYGALDVTKFLLEQNVNWKSIQITKQYSLLDYAIDADTFQFLLQKGVECTSTCLESPSLLSLYCPTVPRLNRSLETFKLLYKEKQKLKVVTKEQDDDIVDKLDYWTLIYQLPAVFRYYWNQQSSETQIMMLLEENNHGDMLLHYAAWKGTKEMFETVLLIYQQTTATGLIPANLMDIKSVKGDTVLHSICYRLIPNVDFLKFMKYYLGASAFCAGLSILNKNGLTAGEILYRQASDYNVINFTAAIKFIIEHCPLDCYFKNSVNDQWRPLLQYMMKLVVVEGLKTEKKEQEEKEQKEIFQEAIASVNKGLKRRVDKTEGDCSKEKETEKPEESQSASKKLKT